ncbi:putative nuclease HARBI1 [Heptranchias perlo]|uniref:putative nuclease HARBI1 n=1 Tax=Heptranchias perlo TaxID=212740 RepID=UPI00355A1EAA
MTSASDINGFTKEFMTEIHQLLQPQLQPQSRAMTALFVAFKVTVALNFYSSGSFQAADGNIGNISQDAYSRAQQTHAATRNIIEHTIGSLKQRLRCLDQSGGALQHSAERISIFVVVCCTLYNLVIMRGQPLPPPIRVIRDLFHTGDRINGWLIRDKGYPLQTWFMTPVMISTNEAQPQCNQSRTTTRCVIEQAIGMLKMRFRCLDRPGGALQYWRARVSRIIRVCCILHNTVQQRGLQVKEDDGPHQASSAGGNIEEEDEEDEEEENEDGPPIARPSMRIAACDARDAFIAHSFSE